MNARFATGAALGTVLVLTGWVVVDTITYQFEPASTLRIEGTSSLHDWSCKAIKMSGELLTEAAPAAEALRDVDALSVRIPVQALKCGHRVMDDRTYRILKADQHPEVVYTLTDLAPAADGTVTATGRLAVAGATHTFTMNARAEAEGANRLRFTGTAPLQMTDFGIEPPSFMNLTTGNDLTVHFDVVLAAR